MAIFHHRVLPAGEMSADIVVFEFIDSVPPVDVGCVFPQFKTKFPYLPLPLSFNLPRIGSRVICAGFSDLPIPDGGFSLDDILCGRVNLLDLYEHRFLAVEGRVNRIFTKRFADGFIEGPCYTVDAEIKHGMCGGPVFSENGYVCGVTSAGVTDFFGEPTSVISLLYPALVMNVRFGGRVGHVRINSNRRLIELIAQGGIITDGSEKFAAKSQEGGDALAGFAFHREDAHCIYDDLSAFRKGRHAAL